MLGSTHFPPQSSIGATQPPLDELVWAALLELCALPSPPAPPVPKSRSVGEHAVPSVDTTATAKNHREDKPMMLNPFFCAPGAPAIRDF